MSIHDSNTVLEAMTTAIVALDNASTPYDIEHMRQFLTAHYPAHMIAIYLARATMRLYHGREAKDVCVEFGITEPVLVNKWISLHDCPYFREGFFDSLGGSKSPKSRSVTSR
jgi:hypothetical protein